MIHKAKKSLGQNFLKSESVLKKIVEAGEVTKKDTVLEIGPGKGALTEHLLEAAGLVVAIEKDNSLYEFLKEKFAQEIESGKFRLLNEDILEVEMKEYGIKDYKILANIPYNITGAILKKFLTAEKQPQMMVLMVQHEVATRILARDAKESLLSVSVKAYGSPKMITKVDKRYFSPAPKVNSAVIKISNINRDIFNTNHTKEDKFWEVVRAGFAHKRKKLSGNLKNLIKKEQFEENKEVKTLFEKRAEDLTLFDWLALSNL